jgi:hypothetical protein
MSGPLLGHTLTLLETQQLLGSLNDFAQMCPFMKGFKYSLNKFLASFDVSSHEQKALPEQARADLFVWAAAVSAAGSGLPIPHRPTAPPLTAMTFVSDAAGAQFARVNGRFVPFGPQNDRGAASISAVEEGPVWFCARVTWPASLLLHARDGADHAYGCKSPTLEAIGAILPFLCCPEKIAGKHVRLLTDNEAVVYGWAARRIQHDESASIIIRALHLISIFLGCTVTVHHLPRMSNASASLADSLTRRSTTGRAELQAIEGAESGPIPEALSTWLRNPSEDWSLAPQLLQAVQRRMEDIGFHTP